MRTAIAIMLLMLTGLPAAAATDEYRVGPEDVLNITVYNNPDLTTLVRVEEDGVIQFPLLGAVAVGGHTVAGISAELERRLADGYLVNPHVTVFVKEFRSRTIVVMGQVKSPGLYELTGPLTVIEAVSRAGGFTDLAAQGRMKIVRTVDGREETLSRVALHEAVKADDVIVVPESLF